ncbi:hypothetical protein [Ulvibacterium marinum]|uniref:hypothetical protein n=1 Tax=Ulvibacterium marinum TaxID=2419782 RepID=UPI0013142235|nr:hypothetical protein [Ulvibacterium marinum]
MPKHLFLYAITHCILSVFVNAWHFSATWPAPRHKFQGLRNFEILSELRRLHFWIKTSLNFSQASRQLAAKANGSILEGLVDSISCIYT